MSFTDTHTHLYLEQFNNDLDTVIENAISSGVNRLFFPAINSNYTDLMPVSYTHLTLPTKRIV